MIFRTLVFSFLIGLQAQAAELPGFCGKVDFRRVSNETLTSLMFQKDLESSLSVSRSQCGLPGETLNICSSCSDEFPESSLRVVRPMLGAKAHLDWHAKWHKVRISDPATVTDETFAKLQSINLIPQDMNKEEFFKAYKFGGTLAGENFFYMHRMMIKMLQFELSMHGKSCIAPWTSLPAKIDDAVWPVPREITSEAGRQALEERLVMLQTVLAKFQDVDYLKSVGLNQLGRALEPTLHQNLHEFYQSSSKCSPEGLAQGFCDDLVPVETSPLNKHFWKIHGLVDDLLGRWLSAHNYKEISSSCNGREACYEWRATWVGKYP